MTKPLPSHTGYPLTVRYGENEPVEVDGRVKAIILALMRDAHGMGIDQDTVSEVVFRLSDGKDDSTWARLFVQHSRPIQVKKGEAA